MPPVTTRQHLSSCGRHQKIIYIENELFRKMRERQALEQLRPTGEDERQR